MKAYEAIAQALVAEGAEMMFGLMGDGNMWIWNSLLRDHPSTGLFRAQRSGFRLDGGRLCAYHGQGWDGYGAPAVRV